MKIGLIVAGVLVLFGILGVACLAFAGNEVAKEIDKSIGTASTDDYELSDQECVVDDVFGAKATGTIENTSEKAQGFQIEVRFETEDGKLLSEDSTFTDTIAVGQSQDWEVLSLEDPAPGTDVTCTVAEVSYTIFDNESGD